MNMRKEMPPEVHALLAAATPFLRINGAERVDWCRDIKDPKDSRIGPWRYRAAFEVLNPEVWERSGEVLYFVTDAQERLRLVGQSKDRLKTRWRTSPMHDVISRAPLGVRALFHTTAWPALERALDNGERPPFTVSALFRNELETVCRKTGGKLGDALQKPETALQRLSYHVETAICRLTWDGPPLWNKQKVPGPQV